MHTEELVTRLIELALASGARGRAYISHPNDAKVGGMVATTASPLIPISIVSPLAALEAVVVSTTARKANMATASVHWFQKRCTMSFTFILTDLTDCPLQTFDQWPAYQ
jgi:hypothetical protein